MSNHQVELPLLIRDVLGNVIKDMLPMMMVPILPHQPLNVLIALDVVLDMKKPVLGTLDVLHVPIHLILERSIHGKPQEDVIKYLVETSLKMSTGMIAVMIQLVKIQP